MQARSPGAGFPRLCIFCSLLLGLSSNGSVCRASLVSDGACPASGLCLLSACVGAQGEVQCPPIP